MDKTFLDEINTHKIGGSSDHGHSKKKFPIYTWRKRLSGGKKECKNQFFCNREKKVEPTFNGKGVDRKNIILCNLE